VPVEGADVLGSNLDEAYAAVTQAALTKRLDLMNARGQVVDAWRQIAIAANSLQGAFDVRYDLNSTTPDGGNNPVAFSGTRSSHQVTFRAELPLVRRAERNNYRAALISYQRQRRTLMAFEDNIATDVRSDVRELRTLNELYKIQKRAVELGYAQVDNAQAVLFAPPEPNAAGNAASAAALTQQVLQAQRDLLQAQNSLYQIWVQYITARMTFYLDLDQLSLDDRGVWRDELLERTGGGGTNPRERLPLPQPAGGGRP
jgi:outer membrane protein TolC